VCALAGQTLGRRVVRVCSIGPVRVAHEQNVRYSACEGEGWNRRSTSEIGTNSTFKPPKCEILSDVTGHDEHSRGYSVVREGRQMPGGRVRRPGHQQTVENQTTNYNPMVLHLRVVTHCTGIYRNILVCHFRITGSRQRVITRYCNPL